VEVLHKQGIYKQVGGEHYRSNARKPVGIEDEDSHADVACEDCNQNLKAWKKEVVVRLKQQELLGNNFVDLDSFETSERVHDCRIFGCCRFYCMTFKPILWILGVIVAEKFDCSSEQKCFDLVFRSKMEEDLV
jgi:hypothetical protein